MGRRYVMDTGASEAVSPRKYRKRKQRRIPNKPYKKYISPKGREFEERVNRDRVLEIMRDCQVGFIKVEERDHEFLIFGILDSKLKGESGSPADLRLALENALKEAKEELGKFSSSNLDIKPRQRRGKEAIESKNDDDEKVVKESSLAIHIRNSGSFKELSFQGDSDREVVGYLCINRQAWSNLLKGFKKIRIG